MNFITIKNCKIGTGMPKICLPIVGKTTEEICQQARSFSDYPCDLAEWRVDWFADVMDFAQVEKTAQALRAVLPDTPILMTFRTKEEGGERSISSADYIRLNCFAARSGLVDALDVELFRGDAVVREIISCAHEQGIAVVVSNHNFTETPAQADIVSRLQKAQALGGDILKIAVMPQTAQDVLTLLAATEEAHRLCSQPLITMSMGPLGAVSRISGEVFGSAVTFGAAGKASAPGQLSADSLHQILSTLHIESENR
ncbi:MAG: type I 3-dehydroquinate dehydratase [Eubacteriales bacterium]|nr:type I 3-dehydroquinate dehydratase [Eubacteriales bacterium]